MKVHCIYVILVLIFTAVSYSGHTQVVEKVTLKIEGMTGSCCAPSINDALLKTNGVKKASVSFDDAEAVVEFNAKEVTTEQIIKAVEKAGYKAMIKDTIEKNEKTKTKNMGSTEINNENNGITEINYLPLSIGILLSVLLVLACLKMKVITSYKSMLRIIKQTFVTKLSMIIGLTFGIIYALIYLLLGDKIAYSPDGFIVNTTFLDILVVLIMAFLIAVVMALFAYATKKCGIGKSKKSGVGLLGLLFALLVSFSACCGPIIVSLIGVGASMILSQYSGLFMSVSIIVLVGGIIISTRTIEKEEKGVCCSSGDYIKQREKGCVEK